MARAKNIFFLLVGLLIIGWSFYTVLQRPAPAKYQLIEPEGSSEPEWPVEAETDPSATAHTLRVGDRVLPVEIADTEALREQGFSGRERPSSGHGILFVFEKPTMPGFWMKDMKFPLDIIWINEDWMVVGVERDVPPASYPASFAPTEPIRYVLELPAGDAAAFNIDRGTKVYLDQ